MRVRSGRGSNDQGLALHLVGAARP